MKNPSLGRDVLSWAAVALVAGCGGLQPPFGGPDATQGSSSISTRSAYGGPGTGPPFLSQLRGGLSAPGAVQSLEYAGLRDVYVTEFLTNTVEMFKNEGYKPNGSITSGINSPDGAFLDRDGNLYVANLGFTGPPGITEYAPRGSSPKFIYGANKIDPVTVSVDRYGHVYDADYIGFVAEYGQGRNKILRSCSPGPRSSTEVRGVAVDQAGDVFITYDESPSGPGHIIKYTGGLSGCKGKVLGVTLDYAGGLTTDKNDKLIVCDMNKPAVDVIAPPYTHVTRTLGSGYSDPLNVTIDLGNTRVFVADAGNGVHVLDYASGALIARLNGSQTDGAVDGPNAVY
ncbi:MAG: hypothetical protein WA742_16415 [Candidatus Cybelea sp.]